MSVQEFLMKFLKFMKQFLYLCLYSQHFLALGYFNYNGGRMSEFTNCLTSPCFLSIAKNEEEYVERFANPFPAAVKGGYKCTNFVVVFRENKYTRYLNFRSLLRRECLKKMS